MFWIGHDIWCVLQTYCYAMFAYSFSIQRLIYHMWMFFGHWLLHLHIRIYDVYIVIQHVHIWEGLCLCNPNISYCDITILFIDANIVLMFVRILLKWEFYVHIHFNDVCIVFDEVDIVIEHIYGMGVLLWKWHKHLTSWCIHIILRCKDYVIVCCLCTENCTYIHTFVLWMSTLHLTLFTFSFGFFDMKA